MTSSGQVTMPDATPAEAPHSALTGPSGSVATFLARAAIGELQLLVWVVGAMSRSCVFTGAGAYWSGAVVGDGGSGSLEDMVRAAGA